MSVPRDSQLSLVEGMERPVGPILPSVFQGTNADLMAAVAPLYLTGSVLDVTYGNGETAGGWWRRFTPEPFTFHDLALDGVDFTDLPYCEGDFDTVCFDPPYVPAGGVRQRDTGQSADEAKFRNAYGLAPQRNLEELYELMEAGLEECARVAKEWVLVKCCDFVTGGAFTLAHFRILLAAANLGLGCHDLIVHHTGPGMGGHNITSVKRARRAHSYLLVFAR